MEAAGFAQFEPSKVPICRVAPAQRNTLSAWAGRARARWNADAARGPAARSARTLQAWRRFKRSAARSRQGLLALHSTALLPTPELPTEQLISAGSPLHWHGTGALQ